jgi:transcriptional regulator with XRE-family HTH domain
MTDGALFGLELQRARERRGLTLDQLAEATKISASLFGGLERGDISRWPNGIFRRAFVRSYAQAVGLEPEETVARFLRLYPDADTPVATPPAASAETAGATPGLVPAEAAGSPQPTGAWRTARRVGAPLLDLLLAGIPAMAVSAVFGWHWFLVVAAGIGLVGHLLALIFIGATPGVWLLLPRPQAARPPVDLVEAPEAQMTRRAEPDATASAPQRRRQPRHASSSRPIPAARTRRVQH